MNVARSVQPILSGIPRRVKSIHHRKAAIGSQLTGQVQAVLVREGDRVRAGQPVIRLNDRALRLEVSEAAAALDAALDLARRGDERAFAELWVSLNPLILRYLRVLVGQAARPSRHASVSGLPVLRWVTEMGHVPRRRPLARAVRLKSRS